MTMLPDSAQTKVLYVQGAGRSGTTLLDTILGQLDGFFSVGELRFVWERNLRDDRVCGCGRPFSACPLWQRIMSSAFAGRPDAVDPHAVITKRETALRLRDTPLAVTPFAADVLRSRNGEYLGMLERLYASIAKVTGARVIVDSSKYPSYGYLLSLLPTVQTFVVHVVRDPRAVAFSWQRRKLETCRVGEIREMGTQGALSSAANWTLWNLLSLAYSRRHGDRYLRIRYEDLMADPQQVLAKVLRHVVEAPEQSGVVADGSVDMKANHTVGGNPIRFDTGRVRLCADDEWRRRMPSGELAMVNALTWPLLLRYGYVGRPPQPATRSGVARHSTKGSRT